MRTEPDQIALRELLHRVGHGLNENGLPDKFAKLPSECFVDTLQEMIDFCFRPELFTDPLQQFELLSKAAILSPRYEDVNLINDRITDCLPGEMIYIRSTDQPLDFGDKSSAYRSDFNIEVINNETPSGLPPHMLKLKVFIYSYKV